MLSNELGLACHRATMGLRSGTRGCAPARSVGWERLAACDRLPACISRLLGFYGLGGKVVRGVCVISCA